MANRHAHKKLRAAIRARMASTGERYQEAHTRLLSGPRAPNIKADLLAVTVYGVPAILATYEMPGFSGAVLIPSTAWAWARGYRTLAPRHGLMMMRSRGMA